MQEIHSILVLDDEQDFRKLALTILKNKFDEKILHEYDPLRSGAPDKDFDWGQYDVLLLDHHLRIENTTGLDILHNNKDNPNFPITIMLTASDDEEIAFKALKLGISDFIRKQELTKKILFASIEDACIVKEKKKKQQINLAKIQKIFNKKLFYKSLKKPLEKLDSIDKRIIIGFRISDKENDSEPTNAFIKDRIIRHIAKESCRFFMTINQEPHITLFSETMVAILFDAEAKTFNETELIHNLHQLHIDLPYSNQEVDVSYNLDTCAITLTSSTISQTDLINYFTTACDKAAENKDITKRISIAGIQQLEETESKITAEIPVSITETKELKPENNTTDIEKHEIYDVEFKLNELDEKSKNVINAINEKRIIKTFQPMIMLFNNEDSFLSDHEIYSVSSKMINSDGNDIPGHELLADITNSEVVKYYDRWLLKETISNIMDIQPGAEPCYFLLKLEHESLADATFFNWLRQLLADYDKQRPGKYIILEISHQDISINEKQILALMNFLNSTHSFRFALGNIQDIDTLPDIVPKLDICMLILNYEKIIELGVMETKEQTSENYLMHLKHQNKYIVASDIVDSTTLTTSITAGADLAMGDFIGLPKASFEEEDAIQSYEIETDDFVSSRL